MVLRNQDEQRHVTVQSFRVRSPLSGAVPTRIVVRRRRNRKLSALPFRPTLLVGSPHLSPRPETGCPNPNPLALPVPLEQHRLNLNPPVNGQSPSRHPHHPRPQQSTWWSKLKVDEARRIPIAWDLPLPVPGFADAVAKLRNGGEIPYLDRAIVSAAPPHRIRNW